MEKTSQNKLEQTSHFQSFLINLLQNKKLVVNFLVLLFIFGALLSYMGVRHNKSISQAFQLSTLAQNSYPTYLDKEEFSKFKHAAITHKSLQAQVDTQLARYSLEQGQLKNTMSYLNRIYKRTGDYNSLFKEFNQITQLIEAESYQKALDLSYELDKTLSHQVGHDTLKSLNMLRVASLEEKLGRSDLSKRAIDQLLREGNLESFKVGQLSLEDYLIENAEL